LIEKSHTDNPDYRIPAGIKELYEKRDYGMYADEEEMHVCFITNCHTSGGNSGSPVFDRHGRLIGINFDRCWEGTMSDYYYNSDICRNIVTDIRYILFIIDKYAGAGYLLDEMKIIHEQ